MELKAAGFTSLLIDINASSLDECCIVFYNGWISLRPKTACCGKLNINGWIFQWYSSSNIWCCKKDDNAIMHLPGDSMVLNGLSEIEFNKHLIQL